MIIQSISQITSLSYPRYSLIFEILIDNFFYSIETKRIALEAFIIRLVLLTSYFSLARIFCWYFGIDRRVPKELLNLNKGSYIIVANHKKAIDPYVILATLPFETFRTLLPIRFFTANIFLEHWWQKCLLLPFGCFRAYSAERKISGVKGGLYLSDRGQTLFIFPQGKRIKNTSKSELKIGVGYLAQKRNFTILPSYINYQKKGTKVYWGEPFKISYGIKNQSLEKITSYIFDKVLSLPVLDNKYEK